MFCQRDSGVEIQLVHNAELVELDGLDRDVEQRGDLFRTPSFRDQLQDFALTRGQRRQRRTFHLILCPARILPHHSFGNERREVPLPHQDGMNGLRQFGWL